MNKFGYFLCGLGGVVFTCVLLLTATAEGSLEDHVGGFARYLSLGGGTVEGDLEMGAGDIALDDGTTVSKIYTDDDKNTYMSASADNRISFTLSGGLLYEFYTTRFQMTGDLYQYGNGNFVKNIDGPWFVDDSVRYAQADIAIDDATPSMAGNKVHTTRPNTVATAITDLDDVVAGEIYIICGGSNTNSSTIADSGNFNLTAAITLNLDTCITLLVVADNDYLEIARAVN